MVEQKKHVGIGFSIIKIKNGSTGNQVLPIHGYNWLFFRFFIPFGGFLAFFSQLINHHLHHLLFQIYIKR